MMSEDFTFNARQYFDFGQNQEDSEGDSFFEIVQEHEPLTVNGRDTEINEKIPEPELSDPENDSMFFTPITATDAGISTSTFYLKSKIRRSLSTSNLPTSNTHYVEQAMDEMRLEHHDERPSSSCSHKSRKTCSKERINILAQPKRYNSSDNVGKNETMTLAEAVKKFQAGTPRRFRTKPSPKINKHAAVPWGGTKGHSPKLLTNQRARPIPSNILSREEREKLEMEEAKKFKIRAHPVNKKILKGPVKPHIEKQPITVVEPFNLTAVKKREQVEPPKIPVFKAQPLPKSLYNPSKLQNTEQKTTKAQTPNIAKRLHRSLPNNNKIDINDKTDAALKPFKPTRTEPKPFSFEKRDQQLQKKKEEFINKIWEEEKRAREFHARPPPKEILRSKNQNLTQSTDTNSVKSYKRSTEELEMITTFRARPATVLHMKPFEPKKEENHDLRTEPFQFSTDQRAEARQKFEQQLKEKEEMKEAAKRELEEFMKQKEEEEVIKLRKQTTYKAQPIKKYKEIIIERSNKVTEPISPVFHTDRIRNKENIEH